MYHHLGLHVPLLHLPEQGHLCEPLLALLALLANELGQLCDPLLALLAMVALYVGLHVPLLLQLPLPQWLVSSHTMRCPR